MPKPEWADSSVKQILKKHDGNKTAAAKYLGWSRGKMYRWGLKQGKQNKTKENRVLVIGSSFTFLFRVL